MISAIEKEINELDGMSMGELREKYRELFKEDGSSNNKRFYVKRIAWRILALKEGSLSERARRRAAELADENDLRILPPKRRNTVEKRVMVDSKGYDHRLPMPGTVITRMYKGAMYSVAVLKDGFEFEGRKYRTLSAVANAITGAHLNGYGFFGLESGKKVKK